MRSVAKSVRLLVFFVALLSGELFALSPPVQHIFGTSSSNASTLSVVLGASATTGNTIIIGGSGVSTSTITSITDTAGNTYTHLTACNTTSTGGRYTDLWYAANITGGFTTITVHYSASNTNRKEAYAIEEAGLDLVSPPDAQAVKTDTGCAGGGTTCTGAAVTSIAANTFVVGLFRTSNTCSNTGAGGGFTNLDASNAGCDEYQIATTAGTYTPVFTTTLAPTDDAYCTASFKAASAGGATNYHPRGFIF